MTENDVSIDVFDVIKEVFSELDKSDLVAWGAVAPSIDRVTNLVMSGLACGDLTELGTYIGCRFLLSSLVDKWGKEKPEMRDSLVSSGNNIASAMLESQRKLRSSDIFHVPDVPGYE